MAGLRTLGALELDDSNGRPIDAILSRQRRAALLVYLAVEARSGFVRRDPLLAMFWPEMDEARARAALRQALYVLRSEAGEDFVVTRGADEVGVSPSLECDVTRFEQLSDAGDHAAALALYRGPFLHGFHIPDAPEFERWVDARRETLRRRAVQCAKALAADRTRAGDVDGAAAAWRRALEFDPSDEQAVRALMGMLNESGDRVGALRAYDAFAQALEQDLGVAPSPETRAMADAIRGAPPAPGAWASAVEAAGASVGRGDTMDDTGRVRSGESSDFPVDASAAREARGRRRWVLAAAATVILAAGVGGIQLLRSAGAASPAEPRLVVMPFAVRGGVQVAYLGEGMADMLSTSLDGPELYRSVPPTSVLNDVKARGTAPDDPSGSRATARRFGAEHFIVGSVVSAAGQLRLDARLFGAGDTALVRASVTGHPDSIFHLVDRLAARLIGGSLGRGPTERLQQSAALTTTSLSALRDYLQAERALREGEFGVAQDLLRKAVAADSTFALGYYRLSMAAEWLGDPAAARENAVIAQRHLTRLSVRDRTLLTAHNRMLQGHFAEAERDYRAILAESPDDPEAWLKLGEVLFHGNPLVGRSIREARVPFFRVLSYDPRNRTALVHLVRIAATAGDLVELDSLTARYLALGVEEGTLAVRALGAARRRDRAALAALARSAEAASEEAVAEAARVSFLHTGNADAALTLLAANTGPNRSDERQALTHLQMAAIELTRGRRRAAHQHFVDASGMFPAVARDLEIYYALRSELPMSRAELTAMRDRLADTLVDRVSRLRRMLLISVIAAAEPQTRLALLSEVSDRLGDTTAGARYAAELAASRGSSDYFASTVARELRAQRDLATGQPARTLAALRYVPPRDAEAGANGFPWVAGLRIAHAAALEATGREREARAWYGSLEYQSLFLYPLIGRALLHDARITERLGDRAGARQRYERLAGLWSDADPEYAPAVALARARAAALRQ